MLQCVCRFIITSGVFHQYTAIYTFSQNLNEDGGKMIEEWVSFIETCADNYENEILRLTLSQVIGSGNVTFVLVEPLQGFGRIIILYFIFIYTSH